MASKDQRPKTRLGKSHPRPGQDHHLDDRPRCCAAAAASRRTATPARRKWKSPVARVRRADFVVSVRTRGDIKSARSTILKAPQVPGLRIMRLAANGRPVTKGDVVVEFDGVEQEQNVISPHHQRAGGRRRHRADEGHAEDGRRSGRDEQDVVASTLWSAPSWTPARRKCSPRSKARRTGFRWASPKARCSR